MLNSSDDDEGDHANTKSLLPHKNRSAAVKQPPAASAAVDAADTSSSSSSSSPTMYEEFKLVVVRPVFLCMTFAYAAQTAVLIGLATFGSAFFMGLGYFDTESEASTVFGLVSRFCHVC